MILPSGTAVRWAGILAAGSLSGVVMPGVGWAFAAAAAGVAAAVVLDGLRLPRGAVQVERRIPLRLSINERGEVVEELRNLSDLPLEVRSVVPGTEGLGIEASSSEEIRLGPRAAVRRALAVRPVRRGEHLLARATVRYGRPGGLAVRQEPAGEPSRLKVFPNVARVMRYEALRRARALATLGIHATRLPGLGVEFDHLRSYAQGDDFRRIHWKATARRSLPVSQVVRTERGQAVLLAVDVSHWMGISAGTLTRLDHAVDAALFLAHVARTAGDRVGLALFAHEVLSFLPPSSSPAQVRRILEALYDAKARPFHPSYRNLARHLLARRLPRSLVVVLSEPPDPESARELAASMGRLRPRHAVLCVGLQDPALAEAAAALPERPEDLFRRLAAGERIEERRERLRAMRERGLNALDALPEELSVRLVNRYLELKSRGAA